jgi:Tol biopolymer transport system component
MICDRSPDGQKIAYVSRPVAGHAANSWLNWLDLSELSKSGVRFFPQYSPTGVTELAFSPDSRQLAFFSHPNPLVSGTLSIMDLPSQTARPIYTTGDVKSLVWSPDGKFIAFIDRLNPSAYQESVLVISSADGALAYTAPLDILNRPVKDWPMLEWGVDFPVEMGGLDACAAPPYPVIR